MEDVKNTYIPSIGKIMFGYYYIGDKMFKIHDGFVWEDQLEGEFFMYELHQNQLKKEKNRTNILKIIHDI